MFGNYEYLYDRICTVAQMLPASVIDNCGIIPLEYDDECALLKVAACKHDVHENVLDQVMALSNININSIEVSEIINEPCDLLELFNFYREKGSHAFEPIVKLIQDLELRLVVEEAFCNSYEIQLRKTRKRHAGIQFYIKYNKSIVEDKKIGYDRLYIKYSDIYPLFCLIDGLKIPFLAEGQQVLDGTLYVLSFSYCGVSHTFRWSGSLPKKWGELSRVVDFLFGKLSS